MSHTTRIAVLIYILSPGVTALAQNLPTLHLTSPHGGEMLQASGTFTITWTSTDPSSYVYFAVFNGSWVDIGNAPMSQGSYEWHVCPYIGDADQCSLRVEWYAGGEHFEEFSDGSFKIVGSTPRQQLRLISPNGGQAFQAGSSYTITWQGLNAVPYSETVYCELYKGGSYYAGATSVRLSADTIGWSICPTVADGSDYTIRVTGWDCMGLLEDFSDAPFTIHSSLHPSLGLLSPNGREALLAGQPMTLRWTSTDLTGSVSATLHKDGQFVSALGAAPAAQGQLTTTLSASLPAGSDYTITLSWVGCEPKPEDSSDAPFSIMGAGSGQPSPDFDHDGDVDFDDVQAFEACITGPAIAYNWMNPPAGCTLIPDNNLLIDADLDRDGDVDQDDFGILQRSITDPPDPAAIH